MDTFRFQKGQTLIEVLAAFGVAVLLVSAITVTVIFALSTTQFSKNENIATQYAQQSMETVRSMQIAGGLDDLVPDTHYCLSVNGDLTIKTSINCTPDNAFVRELIINPGNSTFCHPDSGNQSKQATIDVKWSDSKCTNTSDPYCHTAEISSCLPKSDSLPTPGQSLVSPTPTP